jgi:soluble lytic murein transglycosylase-like protein
MLLDQLGQNNLRGAISAHNKGAGNYQKWQRLYPADDVLFTELIPNEENEIFSKLVWKYYLIYKWLDSEADANG